MRVLFVAMPHHVHTTRWTHQLVGRGWDLHMFPSAPLYYVNSEMREMTVHGSSFFSRAGIHPSVKLLGVRPLPGRFVLGLMKRWFPWAFDEVRRLAGVVDRIRPDVIHSLEIQYAGYLTLEAKSRCRRRFPPWVVTNWGGDVHHFRQFADHESKLRAVFASCDYYDCECHRDVLAARELGFLGTVLPVTPNTGGFDLAHVRRLAQPGPTSARRLILLKGYQNWAGRAVTALQALGMCADVLREYRVVIYLASPETVAVARTLAASTGLRIDLVDWSPHEEMLSWHGRARMSIGVSVTDGVSTSFLEALVMGSFPIQTCTACADEWVTDGVTGLIVRPDDVDGIARAIRRAATDDGLVDRAAELNAQTADARLDYDRLRDAALALYQTIVRERPQNR